VFFYTLISTLTWNFVVLFLALHLRQDWRKIDAILTAYGWLILLGMVVVAGIVVIKIIRRHRRSNVA
jgi:membrane protein DedA with SNARE-associated domain